jgi:hypothetical protein
MILPFSTQMNGNPTYFVEKILNGLVENNLITGDEWVYRMNPPPLVKYPKAYGFVFNQIQLFKPKLHTIREDEKDRWKAGNKIDYFINCRQKDMFRFAPVLPVVSTQKVEIKWFEWFGEKMVRVFIDGKAFAWVKINTMLVAGEMLQLAQNDGFDTIEDFFAYFNEDFKGKIIHWTELRY